MRKLFTAIKKEWWILRSDKAGLLLLFGMPILMVFIVTMVQNSSFEMAQSNRLKITVINNDQGRLGEALIRKIQQTNSFLIHVEKAPFSNLPTQLLENDQLLLVQIPADFTRKMTDKANQVSSDILSEMGMSENQLAKSRKSASELMLYYNPVLQENYRQSIASMMTSFVAQLESETFISAVFKTVGVENNSQQIIQNLQQPSVQIAMLPASHQKQAIIPNATQHNVPAWTLFAMFFMVVSLGSNLVRERQSASYLRLQLIPNSHRLVIWSKALIYFIVAMAQITVIFALGIVVFPLIGLPKLMLPSAVLPLIVVSIGAAACAIVYAVLIGTFSKTVEQANGIGAISILVFAAIGGIWVPTFVMPDYLKTIGMISPLQWCLKGYYRVFLEGAGIENLGFLMLYFVGFIGGCLLLISWKSKHMQSLK
jgi:ABC-2 type transport system permease protein